jgi:hypothetical protein
MKTALRRLVTLSGVVVVMFLPTQPAQALATLQADVVGATCTVTTPEGTTTAVPCSADSWVVALQPNWSAQMVATIEYAYADDGLPLARPEGITIEPNLSVRHVFYEAGALYVHTSRCSGRGCETGRDWEQYTGQPNFYPPVFISDNEIADSLNGTLTVSTGAFFASPPPLVPPYTWSPTIFVGIGLLSELTFSGVIPEPSTYVLMLLGLGAVASTALRRSRRTVNR